MRSFMSSSVNVRLFSTDSGFLAGTRGSCFRARSFTYQRRCSRIVSIITSILKPTLRGFGRYLPRSSRQQISPQKQVLARKSKISVPALLLFMQSKKLLKRGVFSRQVNSFSNASAGCSTLSSRASVVRPVLGTGCSALLSPRSVVRGGFATCSLRGSGVRIAAGRAG